MPKFFHSFLCVSINMCTSSKDLAHSTNNSTNHQTIDVIKSQWKLLCSTFTPWEFLKNRRDPPRKFVEVTSVQAGRCFQAGRQAGLQPMQYRKHGSSWKQWRHMRSQRIYQAWFAVTSHVDISGLPVTGLILLSANTFSSKDHGLPHCPADPPLVPCQPHHPPHPTQCWSRRRQPDPTDGDEEQDRRFIVFYTECRAHKKLSNQEIK